jgi:hypothetical protein
MPGMPYSLEKSPLFTVIEDYVSLRTRRLTLLRNLRDLRVPFWDTGVLNQPELMASFRVMFPAPAPYIDPAAHVRDHWLGLAGGTYNKTNGHWTQPALAANNATGWWQNWSGPAETILRETLLRTLEVSMGIVHRAASTPSVGVGATAIPTPVGTVPTPANPDLTGVQPPHVSPDPADTALMNRMWPIEILWVCGSPVMQGYVTWRTHGTGETAGQVTMILSTPPTASGEMYDDPETTLPTGVTPPADPRLPWEEGDFKLNPGDDLRDVTTDRGLWLISPTHSEVQVIATSVSVSIEMSWDEFDIDIILNVTWILPGSFHRSVDDPSTVIVLRPPQKDGGVLGTPIHF